MIFLLLSICSSTLIFLLFRSFPGWGVETLPAIVVNYITAFVCGMFLIQGPYDYAERMSQPWFMAAALMGCLFIVLFYLMARTSQTLGVSAASIATKMSLVIPVAWFMLTDPLDEVTGFKLVAVVLAIPGVILSSRKPKTGKFNWRLLLLPLIIFTGSGVIDIIIGSFSSSSILISQNDQFLFTSAPFLTAAVLGTLFILVQAGNGKVRFNRMTLLAGIVLGAVNFSSIYFLVLTLDAELLDRSAIIPVNNLGVVCMSAVLALFMFKERYTVWNYVGIGLSLASILLLILGR
jgi:uncharacterized membrane protein (UPF0136 family)/uncharacterized membrane protein